MSISTTLIRRSYQVGLFFLAFGIVFPVWGAPVALEEDPLSNGASTAIGEVFPVLANFFDDYRSFLTSGEQFSVRAEACRRAGVASRHRCVLDELQAYRVQAADLVGRSIPAVQFSITSATSDWARLNQELSRSERIFYQRKADSKAAVRSVEARVLRLLDKIGDGEGQLTPEARFEIQVIQREWAHAQNSLNHWELHADRLPQTRQSMEAVEQLLQTITDELKLVEHYVNLQLGLLNDFEALVELDVDVRETIEQFNALESVLPRLQELGQSMFDGFDVTAVFGDGPTIRPITFNARNSDDFLIDWLRNTANEI